MKKILVTGNGKLAEALQEAANYDSDFSTKYYVELLPKSEMDIRDFQQVWDYLQDGKRRGFDYLIHTAAICKPMNRVDSEPVESIETNIVGTANVATNCQVLGIKFIYISTDAVYFPEKFEEKIIINEIFSYFEGDSIHPQNKYAWSKLGGECVTQLIPNSLILRCAITEIPFRHEKAYSNVYKNSITHGDAAKNILKLINETGTINIGGKYQSIYEFVKKYQPEIQKIYWADKETSVHLRMNLGRQNYLLLNDQK